LQRLEGVPRLDRLMLRHDKNLIQVPQPFAEHLQGILDVPRLELPKQNVNMSPVGSNQAKAQSTHRALISFNLSAMVMS
jgi:hypothetical protein